MRSLHPRIVCTPAFFDRILPGVKVRLYSQSIALYIPSFLYTLNIRGGIWYKLVGMENSL